MTFNDLLEHEKLLDKRLNIWIYAKLTPYWLKSIESLIQDHCHGPENLNFLKAIAIQQKTTMAEIGRLENLIIQAIVENKKEARQTPLSNN